MATTPSLAGRHSACAGTVTSIAVGRDERERTITGELTLPSSGDEMLGEGIVALHCPHHDGRLVLALKVMAGRRLLARPHRQPGQLLAARQLHPDKPPRVREELAAGELEDQRSDELVGTRAVDGDGRHGTQVHLVLTAGSLTEGDQPGQGNRTCSAPASLA